MDEATARFLDLAAARILGGGEVAKSMTEEVEKADPMEDKKADEKKKDDGKEEVEKGEMPEALQAAIDKKKGGDDKKEVEKKSDEDEDDKKEVEKSAFLSAESLTALVQSAVLEGVRIGVASSKNEFDAGLSEIRKSLETTNANLESIAGYQRAIVPVIAQYAEVTKSLTTEVRAIGDAPSPRKGLTPAEVATLVEKSVSGLGEVAKSEPKIDIEKLKEVTKSMRMDNEESLALLGMAFSGHTELVLASLPSNRRAEVLVGGN